MAASQLLTAARVIAYVNGKPYAMVTGVHWDSSTGRRPIMGLDSSTAFELVPTSDRITGTMMLLRIMGTGGPEGAGMMAPFSDTTREKYFTLTLIDRLTDTQIFRADRCSVTNQNWDISAKGIAQGSVAFEALDWTPEPF